MVEPAPLAAVRPAAVVGRVSPGHWDHADWLDLLESLAQSQYWPMSPNAVGQVVEEAKRRYVTRPALAGDRRTAPLGAIPSLRMAGQGLARPDVQPETVRILADGPCRGRGGAGRNANAAAEPSPLGGVRGGPAWVHARQGRWSESHWLDLLATLQRLPFGRLTPGRLGRSCGGSTWSGGTCVAGACPGWPGSGWNTITGNGVRAISWPWYRPFRGRSSGRSIRSRSAAAGRNRGGLAARTAAARGRSVLPGEAGGIEDDTVGGVLIGRRGGRRAEYPGSAGASPPQSASPSEKRTPPWA